jgi:hypothetical protein
MSDREFHQQNLARIEKHIAELKVRIFELQRRIQTQEDTRRNAEISQALFAILVEHLEVMKIREQQARDNVHADPIIGKAVCRQET